MNGSRCYVHVYPCVVYEIDPFPSAFRAATCFCNDGEARARSNSHGCRHRARPGKSLIIGIYIIFVVLFHDCSLFCVDDSVWGNESDIRPCFSFE